MKRRSAIDQARTMRGLQGRFNPLRGLTPDRLTNYLENYERGYLADAVWLFDRMIARDDLLPGLAEKRFTAPARRNWSIRKLEDSPKAQKHADELEYFYNNLTSTSAIDGDHLEGFSGLIEQMMSATANGWAVHETIWKPEPDGISAEFRFVPLWFFERTTGKLRFTETLGSQNGKDLEPGGWMVTRGPALMISSAVNYMFKSLPKKDWLAFCDKYAVTPVFGRTNAPKDSAEWDAMHDALVDFMTDFMAVVGGEDSFEFPDVPTGQLIPMKDLIELCDKRSMQLWRGGDLSTQSSDRDAVGSERQSQEAEILEANDLRRIVTTLNKRIDSQVIKYTTGDERPLALLEMKIPEHRDIEGDLNTDRFFIEHGIPLPISEIYARYNRREPEKGEDITTTEATVGGVGTRSMIDKHSDGNAKPDPKTGKVQDNQVDPNQEDETEEEEDDNLANEGTEADREALIADAIGRSLDVMPSAMSEVSDLIADLVAAAESGNLGDDELIEAADEAILRMPELLGGRSVTDLARVFEGAMFSAAGQALANAFNPTQPRYPAGHPQGGQWRPVDGNPKNNDTQNDESRDVQSKGDRSGNQAQGGQRQDDDGSDARRGARSGFRVGSDQAEGFRQGITDAASAHKFGWAVDVKDLDAYADPEAGLFLSQDGSAGAMVTGDGDLVSVFKHPDSDADIRAILREATEDSITSDYFDINGVLPNLYRQFGFVPVARVKFNPDYAPPGMPADFGKQPDVVLGIRDVQDRLGLNRPYDEIRDQVPLFTEWDDAANARQQTLEKLADLLSE